MPELSRARELAPDYAVRVDRAYQELQAEQTATGKRVLRRRVELLARAAQAEADRIALLRAAPAHEARVIRAINARAQAERAQAELARHRTVAEAAAREQREAQWVFAALARGSFGSPAERDRIWSLLVRRAQALCAATRALGATALAVDAVELQLTAARTAKLGERVERARAALAAAQGVLGKLRAGQQPSAAMRRDLRERLQERGFDVREDVSAHALVIAWPAAQSPREPLRRASLLDDLLQAFPHGPIQLSCGRNVGCAPGWFGASARGRVQVWAGEGGQSDAVVRVALPAYAEASWAR